MFVVDTSVLSEVMRAVPEPAVIGYLDRLVEPMVFITAITVAEVRYGLARLPAGQRQSRLIEAANHLFELFAGRILPFDHTAGLYGTICPSRKSIGRPMGYADAMIAAICRDRGATLVSRNIDAFASTGVVVINPWNPAPEG